MDRSIFLWVVEHRVSWLNPIFVGLSVLGYFGLVWIALAPLVSRLAGRSAVFGTVFVATCIWAADLISLGIKVASGRPRPFETIPDVETLLGATVSRSFPSGHAATSFAGAVALTYLLPRAAPFVFLLATAIAFSRIYVGVHYPSDVVIGAALGAAVGLVGVGILRLLRRTSAGRPRSEGPPRAG